MVLSLSVYIWYVSASTAVSGARRPPEPDANMWAARAEGVSERGDAMKTVRTVELYALKNLPRSKLLPQARVVKVVHERRTARAY